MLGILLATLSGICAGVITGLLPGIHINLVSALLFSSSGFLLGFFSPLALAVFIIAMGITHSFLDSIPSVFLGAPDEDKVMAVLPGHKLLLEGLGFFAVKLMVLGSFFGMLLCTFLTPFLLAGLPFVYSAARPVLGWLLLAIVLLLVFREGSAKKMLWALLVFACSGIIGFIVLGSAISQPLLPMLSGLFGTSTLVVSLFGKNRVLVQRNADIGVPLRISAKGTIAGTITGVLLSVFPALGPSQGAALASAFFRMTSHSYLVLVGATGTVNFFVSLIAFYTIGKARNGAVEVAMDILAGLNKSQLVVLVVAGLVAGAISLFLALRIAKLFAGISGIATSRTIAVVVIVFVSVLVCLLSGIPGMLVLFVCTCLGIIAQISGCSRSNAMGCLLLPVIFNLLT